MSYTYTDVDGDKLVVEPSNVEGLTRYTVIDDEEREHTIVVPNARVPEVCVGSLKVIGLDPKEFPSDHLRQGVWHLAHHVENEAKKAAKEEAERLADEKVLAFCLHIGWTTDPTYKVNNYDRNLYEKAMEFATTQDLNAAAVRVLDDVAKGNLRVINSTFELGNFHRHTDWRDIHGFIWCFNEKQLRWEYRHPSHTEGTASTPTNFPWTEVVTP